MSRFNVYQVDDALCLSHSLSLSLSSVCSPTHSPPYQSFTHPFILFLTLLLCLSLSLSLVCTCELACVSLSPSFSRFRPCILSQAFCLSLSFSFTHTFAHTQSHALSLIHSLTNAHTHQIFIPIISRSLTHISLSSSLSLSFLSLSLSLSLSLLHTYTDTHTHLHSHTLSFIHSLIHSLIVVACARCVVFSARTRALSSFCFSLPSSLSYSFPL